MFTIFLTTTDFSFTLLVVTFEPLRVQQRYIPLLTALMCGINGVGAQGRSCRFTLYHAHLKMGVLLHKQATVRFDLILAVYPLVTLIRERKLENSTGKKFSKVTFLKK